MEKEAARAYAKKVEKIEKRHFSRHGKRKMTLAELDVLCLVRG